jgi:hypothetical protein
MMITRCVQGISITVMVSSSSEGALHTILIPFPTPAKQHASLRADPSITLWYRSNRLSRFSGNSHS